MGLLDWMQKKSAQKAFSNIERDFPRFVTKCELLLDGPIGPSLNESRLLDIMTKEYTSLLWNMTNHPDLQRAVVGKLESFMSDDYFRLELNPYTKALITELYKGVKQITRPDHWPEAPKLK